MHDFEENSDIFLSDPVLIDDDGLYITIGQLLFWLNDRRGKELFEIGSKRFFKYYDSCRAYNMISDMLEEDPDCASLFWDNKREVVAISFPAKGKVSRAFKQLNFGEIL